jgi:hypothetical protein
MAADEEEPGLTISAATLSRGLYSQPGFRHKGWVSLDVEDRNEPFELCEACQRRQVRFVHLLRHSDESEANKYGHLEAGCVCAGFLTEDYEGAAGAERRVRNETARKKSAAKREQDRVERIQLAEIARREMQARRRLVFSSSWSRDAVKSSTTRQGGFTVFRRGNGYGLRTKAGFVKASFNTAAEAEAYALAIEFKDVVPEYETKS